VNTIEVIDNVRALLPQIESQLPPSVHMLVRGDRFGEGLGSIGLIEERLSLQVAGLDVVAVDDA